MDRMKYRMKSGTRIVSGLGQFSVSPTQELVAIDTDDGVLLRPVSAFPSASMVEVASCLHYKGKPKSLEEMEEAIKVGAKKTA